MKNYLKTFWAAVLMIGFAATAFAQETAKNPLALGRIASYEIQVTYDKTSHLIFPSAIRYVDLGSEYLIAGKAFCKTYRCEKFRDTVYPQGNLHP